MLNLLVLDALQNEKMRSVVEEAAEDNFMLTAE